MEQPLRRFFLGLAPVLLTGCHSAFIQATVTNHTGRPVRLFEVDYPTASFGSGSLADGDSFHYRFKALGEGSVKVLWTDADGHDHTVEGTLLHEGDEGQLDILIESNSARFVPKLTSSSHP